MASFGLLIALSIGAVSCGSDSETSTQSEAVASDTGDDTELGENTQTEDDAVDSSPENATDEPADSDSATDSQASTSEELTLGAFENVLLPTWLPNGWEQHTVQSTAGQFSVSYGEAGSEPPLTLLVSEPNDRALNLDAIHRRDLTEAEWISVRGGTDNAVLVTSFEDGSTTIAFIENGLLYQAILHDEALPDQGRRFVEGLAPPPAPEPETETPAEPGSSESPVSPKPSESESPGSEPEPTESKGGPGDIDN